MKFSITPLVLLLFVVKANCQDYVPKKSIYFELGGSAGILSLNYENIFADKKKINFLWRVGISGFPIDRNAGFVLVLPVAMGAIIGEGNHKLELGIGQGISITTIGRIFARMAPIIGYRYQNPEKRIFYRFTYTPLVSYLLDFQYQHWAGISIGYKLTTAK